MDIGVEHDSVGIMDTLSSQYPAGSSIEQNKQPTDKSKDRSVAHETPLFGKANLPQEQEVESTNNITTYNDPDLFTNDDIRRQETALQKILSRPNWAPGEEEERYASELPVMGREQCSIIPDLTVVRHNYMLVLDQLQRNVIDTLPLDAPERDLLICQAQWIYNRIQGLGMSIEGLQQRYLELGHRPAPATRGTPDEETGSGSTSYSPTTARSSTGENYR